MTTYYRFVIPVGPPVGHVARDPEADLSLVRLLRGMRLDADELPPLCRFTLRHTPGTPLEPSDLYKHVHLMSTRMLEVLRQAGVSNLQTWPAQIRILATGEVLSDYVVFNVVGLASCADASASESVPLAEGRYFTELAIDPARTGGARIFRLAESPIELIVDESVATAIARADLRHIELEPVHEPK